VNLEIKPILAQVKHPQTNGKIEKWFDSYRRFRKFFASFDECVDLNRYTLQLCCDWDRPMQQRNVVSNASGIQHTPNYKAPAQSCPGSSAAVGCAGATFDCTTIDLMEA